VLRVQSRPAQRDPRRFCQVRGARRLQHRLPPSFGGSWAVPNCSRNNTPLPALGFLGEFIKISHYRSSSETRYRNSSLNSIMSNPTEVIDQTVILPELTAA
jgi:hypothetical protein